MLNPDIAGFVKRLDEKWPGQDRSRACAAYVGSVLEGMNPYAFDELIDFLKAVGVANLSLGEYFGRHRRSAAKSRVALSSIFTRVGNVELPFLKEKEVWEEKELLERSLAYLSTLMSRLAGRPDSGRDLEAHRVPAEVARSSGREKETSSSPPASERGPAPGPTPAPTPAPPSGSAPVQEKDLNYYFQHLLRAKGPKFMDEIPRVSQLVKVAGIKGLTAFTREAMNSLGLSEEMLEGLYEGGGSFKGKGFPDWILELIVRSDVDNYIVAYAYELIDLYLGKGRK